MSRRYVKNGAQIILYLEYILRS
uniref:Uncharacterized protein n=1 Tax=Rhizophora mucronata TaxID=61149 RepID=A0A2P2QK88_RHIMU